jgi:uncharacterized protein
MTQALCPICKRPATAAFRPFCSKRCADVDLQRWFTGAYAIPGSPVEDEEDSAPAEDD